jgi:hypothetical protein
MESFADTAVALKRAVEAEATDPMKKLKVRGLAVVFVTTNCLMIPVYWAGTVYRAVDADVVSVVGLTKRVC